MAGEVLPEVGYAFTAGPFNPSNTVVVHVHHREAMSELYECAVMLAAPLQLAPDSAVTQPATFEITRQSLQRKVKGVVRRVEDVGTAGRYRFVRVFVVPELWLLSKRMSSRIFQDKKTVEIIQDVLKDAGVYQGSGGLQIDGGLFSPGAARVLRAAPRDRPRVRAAPPRRRGDSVLFQARRRRRRDPRPLRRRAHVGPGARPRRRPRAGRRREHGDLRGRDRPLVRLQARGADHEGHPPRLRLHAAPRGAGHDAHAGRRRARGLRVSDARDDHQLQRARVHHAQQRAAREGAPRGARDARVVGRGRGQRLWRHARG